MILVELDRAEQEREITVKGIKDGIAASTKKSGRKQGQLDKMSPELEKDIKKFLTDRRIKQIDLMNKYNNYQVICNLELLSHKESVYLP